MLWGSLLLSNRLAKATIAHLPINAQKLVLSSTIALLFKVYIATPLCTPEPMCKYPSTPFGEWLVKQKLFLLFSVLPEQSSTLVAHLASLHDNNDKHLKQCMPHVQFHNARHPLGSANHITSHFGIVAAPPTSIISCHCAPHIIAAFMKAAGNLRSTLLLAK
jgi:hypothetical protein